MCMCLRVTFSFLKCMEQVNEAAQSVATVALRKGNASLSRKVK